MKSAGSNEGGKSGQGTRLFTAAEFCSREKNMRLRMNLYAGGAALRCVLDIL